MTENFKNRLRSVISFIREYRKENGFQPTYKEIADDLSVSATMIKLFIDALEKLGCIERFGGGRAIKILKEVDDV